MVVDGLPKNAKEIPTFPDYYATPEGDIWSGSRKYSPRCNKLKPALNSEGRPIVSLCKNNQVFTRVIYRLILETFIGPCPKGMEGCHKNDIRTDNELKNLRWDTHFNNAQDALRNNKYINPKGEKSHNAKLNNLQVRIIRRLLEFRTLTQKEIGKIFKVHRYTISQIKTGKNWK